MGDQENPEVFEGEIVWGDGRRDSDSGRSRRGRYNPDVTEDDIRGVIADRVRGMTLREVADKWSCSVETVRRWCNEDKKKRASAEAPKLRAEAAQQLEVVRDSAWEMYRAAQLRGMPKTMNDALTRVESATMAKAKLEGAILPVRIDLQVTELSAAEQELQEMINEAQAKAVVDEQAVIDAASADPDL